jgi:hypothetical protein
MIMAEWADAGRERVLQRTENGLRISRSTLVGRLIGRTRTNNTP